MAIFGRVYSGLLVHFARLKRAWEVQAPYLTAFILSAGMPSILPKLQDFPGLILVQYADAAGRVEVTAYWQTREAATVSLTYLKSALCGEVPTQESYLRKLDGPSSSWWKRIPLGRALLFASSIVGALTIMQTYVAKSIEAPDIALAILGPRELAVLESDEINFEIAITNRSREVTTVVTLFSPTLTQPPNTSIAGIAEGNLKPPPIAASTTTVVPFSASSVQPGLYELTLRAHARAGTFRPPPHAFSTSKKVRVWRIEPETNVLPISRLKNPFGAVLLGRLFIGTAAPMGLKCRASIAKTTSVSFAYVDFPGTSTFKRLPDALTPGKEVRSIEFSTARPFDALRRYTFRLTLKATEPDTDWNAVKNGATVECVRIEKESSDAA